MRNRNDQEDRPSFMDDVVLSHVSSPGRADVDGWYWAWKGSETSTFGPFEKRTDAIEEARQAWCESQEAAHYDHQRDE